MRTRSNDPRLQELTSRIATVRRELRSFEKQLAGLESELGLPSASPTVPGAAPLSSAIGSAGTLGGHIRSSTSTPVQILQLQEALQQIAAQFQSTSNILKSRHDQAKALIRNMRA